jgi:N-ethylmaleimide reductase
MQLGEFHLKNRIFMAPMTRGRAGPQGIPNEIMATYYAQRSSAGLIIAEATAVSEQGRGWANSPGIYNDLQQQGWTQVANSVHEKQGIIFMQLWHMGRMVLPDFIEGKKPVAPSAIAASGEFKNPTGQSKPFVEPQALTQQGIDQVITDFRLAARRAVDAGLDGVEIHAANGFLIDQFTRSSTNKRQDAYGGNYKNRAKFLLEVTKAVVDEIGGGKVGIRLSPTSGIWGINDENPQQTFGWLVEQLNAFNMAYLHLLEPAKNVEHPMSYGIDPIMALLRSKYDGLLIANAGFTSESGAQVITNKEADAVAFGVPFIANPDLVLRYRQQLELAVPDADTFYTQGERGYCDYPFSA